MKFKLAYKKGTKYLLKIVLDDGEEKWATTTDKVYNYAKNNFEENEECGFEYKVKNGQYFVDRILKDGTSKKTESSETETSEYTCEDCGAKLKDSKYKKCYICNKKNPSKSSGTGAPSKGAPYGTLMPEEATRRNKLATLSSICSAIQVMTGQVADTDTLADMILTIHDKVYKKLFG